MLHLELSDEQRKELYLAVTRHPKSYVRERAAALLKIAQGHSGAAVAREGLLLQHKPDTIYRWVKGYRAAGLQGLYIKAGRGRKPAYFPPVSGRFLG